MSRSRQQRVLEKSTKNKSPVRTYVVAEYGGTEAWQNPRISEALFNDTLFWQYENGVVLTYYEGELADLSGMSSGYFYESLEYAARDHRMTESGLKLHWGHTVGNRLGWVHLDPDAYGTWDDKAKRDLQDEIHQARRLVEDCETPQVSAVWAVCRSIRMCLRKPRGWQRKAVQELAELLCDVEHPLPPLRKMADALAEKAFPKDDTSSELESHEARV